MMKYNKIPQNEVIQNSSSVNANVLQIKVNKSSSPLIFKLASTETVSQFKIDLEISGQLNGPLQKPFEEDSYLRMGFVVPGEKTLKWYQKKFAADWVLKLFDLAPKDQGIDRIEYFNITREGLELGTSRVHPKSELIKETIISIWKKTDTRKIIEYKLKNPLKAVALWISTDGDDSKSNFEIKIHKLELN